MLPLPRSLWWNGSDDLLRRYRHSKFSKWEVGRQFTLMSCKPTPVWRIAKRSMMPTTGEQNIHYSIATTKTLFEAILVFWCEFTNIFPINSIHTLRISLGWWRFRENQFCKTVDRVELFARAVIHQNRHLAAAAAPARDALQLMGDDYTFGPMPRRRRPDTRGQVNMLNCNADCLFQRSRTRVMKFQRWRARTSR